MKKIILLLIVFSLFSSCTRCDDEPLKPYINNTGPIQGTISVKINDVEMQFDNIILDQTGREMGYRNFTIKATNSNSDTISSISFNVLESNMGLHQDNTYTTTFEYTGLLINNEYYSVYLIPIVNSNNILKATFEGQLARFNEETEQYDIVTFTNGKMDILLTDL